MNKRHFKLSTPRTPITHPLALEIKKLAEAEKAEADKHLETDWAKFSHHFCRASRIHNCAADLQEALA